MAVRTILGINLQPQEADLAFELLKQIHTIYPDFPKLNPTRVIGGPFDVLTGEIVTETASDLFIVILKIRGIEGVDKVLPQFIQGP